MERGTNYPLFPLTTGAGHNEALTCRSISWSLYSIALSTYSFLFEKVSGILFPPGIMGTILPSALWPTKESKGIICNAKQKKPKSSDSSIAFYYKSSRTTYSKITDCSKCTSACAFRMETEITEILRWRSIWYSNCFQNKSKSDDFLILPHGNFLQ